MDIGCHLPNQGPLATGEALVRFAREAEQRSVASLWVSDHVIFPRSATGSYPGGRFPHPPDKPYLEPVTVLAAAAVCTSRARLGASVFILGHRHPVVMAKMLTSIDALSNGRLICGVGVGWWKEELEILGVPFHARGRHGDEILRAFKALDCEGLARVDFFYEEATGRVLVNEVNTIPGFTPKSMFPMLWAASGLAYPDLVARLVDLAVERHRARKR